MMRKIYKVCIFFFVLVSTSYVLYAQNLSAVQIYNSGTRILYEGIDQGNTEKVNRAISLFFQSLEINPNYYNSIKQIMIAYYALGELDKSREFLQKAFLLQRDDRALYLLEIFFTLKDEDFISSNILINAFKQKYPNNIDVVYMELIYYSMLANPALSSNIFLELIKKDQSNSRSYVNVYKVAEAIVYNRSNLEAERNVLALSQKYPQQLWMQWLLSNYHRMSGDNNGQSKSLDLLAKSNIPKLEEYAVLYRVEEAIKKKDLEFARDIVAEYTTKYPQNEMYWKILGAIYYQMNDYRYAERALNRSLVLNEDTFVRFMYATVLKVSRDLASIRKKYVDKITVLAEAAYGEGNLSLAKSYIERAIYIDPLAINARRQLISIHQSEGDLFLAIREIDTLRALGYQDADISLLRNSFVNTLYGINDANPIKIPTVSERYRETKINKVWNMELGKVSHPQSTNKDVFYNEIQRKLLEYYFIQSKIINWTSQFNGLVPVAVVDIEYFSQNTTSLMKVNLRDKSSGEVLHSFQRVYTDKNYMIQSAQDIIAILDNMVPKIAEVVYVDDISDEIVLDTMWTQAELEKPYFLYPNKLTYNFRIRKDNEYFTETTLPKGRVVLFDTRPRYSLAKPYVADMESTDEKINALNLQKNVVEGDFIVVPPVDWNTLTTQGYGSVQEETQYYQKKIANYLLDTYVMDFLVSDVNR